MESQPAILSTVLMHLFNDITLKVQMLRSRDRRSPRHLQPPHFGTARALWHLLSAGLPLPSCQMLSRTRLSDISVAKIQSLFKTKIIRMFTRALRSNYQRFVSRSPSLSAITVIGIVPAPSSSLPALCPWHPPAQYMNPDGMSLGLRNSTLGLCLLGWDL